MMAMFMALVVSQMVSMKIKICIVVSSLSFIVGERFVCYMCYETHDTPSDPLVAPCDCKGDTRYLHVQCLQKWLIFEYYLCYVLFDLFSI